MQNIDEFLYDPDILCYANITLQNGHTIQHARYDAGIFYADTKIDEHQLRNNCNSVQYEIVDEGNNKPPFIEKHNNMQLSMYETIPDFGCRFEFTEIDIKDLAEKQLRADVDFIMMMSGYDE